MQVLFQIYKKQLANPTSIKGATSTIIQAHKNVKRKIKMGNIYFNDVQGHLELDKEGKEKNSDEAILNKRIDEINNRKHAMEKKLKQIQLEESRLKNEQRSSSVPNLHFHGYYRSSITKQQVQKLRQLIKKQQQYEKELEEKAVQHEESIRQMQEEKQEEIKKEREEMFFERKLQAQKNIERIRKRQEQRKKQMESEKQKLLKVKTQQTVYKKMQNDWKKIEEQELKGRLETMKILKERKKVDFEDIKMHETKYEQIMNKNRESRLKNSSVFSANNKKFYQSVFMSRVAEEDSRVKEGVFYKKNMAKDFASRKSDYAELVKKNYQPEIKERDDESNQNKITSVKSMSLFDLNKHGNDYMKQVNSKAKELNPQKRGRKREKAQPVTYHDYLTERRQRKEKQGAYNTKKGYQKQINKIMLQEGLSEEEKFFQAKLAAKKIEPTPQKAKNPFKLIDSINAKIEILKNISH